jgi:argininosuccinate lyase
MILPGYTHLQRAQPVLLAHHLAAHAWMAVRAARRFGTVIELHDECPLGAGALAGANYPLDRAAIARRLGFSRATPNSLDAVSSRAFALDALAAMAACATDASRLGAELVLWSSQEFGFVELPDAWTSGSSIMPQKKNPDAAELVRAKAARVAGAWHTLQSVLQALPLAYAKDLQEDKPAVFDAAETTALVLVALSGMVGGMAVRPDRMSDAARGGMMAATDVADALVGLGVPFREAHGRVGRLVRALADSARTLEEARPDEVGSLHPDLTGDRYRALVSVEATVARKGTAGGTGPAQVRDQLAQLAEAIGAARSGLAAYAHA